MKQLRLILILLFLGGFNSFAQTMIPLKKSNDRRSVSSGSLIGSEREKMLGNIIDAETVIIEKDKYTDERLKQMEQKMNERDWASENTAWERAQSLDTQEGYRKYIAYFPYGEHRSDASKRLVDLEVTDIFNNEHYDMPEFKHVVKDDDSVKSTVIVENKTIYPLTVLYSGVESKKIIISPGSRGTVSIINGQYKIAASVPDKSIKPYAGRVNLAGGRYETGYVVVKL